MDRKICALAIVALFGIVCLVPATSDQSDADSVSDSFRFSDQYVLKTTIHLDQNVTLDYGDYDKYYAVEDSVGDAKMVRYLEDPQNNDIDMDDSLRYVTLSAGTDLNIYSYSDNAFDTVTFQGTTYMMDVVLEPYGESVMEVFVEGGDTFYVDMSVTNYNGGTSSYQIRYGSTYVTVDSSWNRYFADDTTVTLIPASFGFYSDVIYSMSGISSPDTPPGQTRDEFRFSSFHLYRASVYVTAGEWIDIDNKYMYFYDGSYNDGLIESYVSNPRDMDVNISTEDIETYSGSIQVPVDGILNIYYSTPSASEKITFMDRELATEHVLDPYGSSSIPLYVESGDTLTLNVKCVNNLGFSQSCNVSYDMNYTYLNGEWSRKFDKATEVTVEMSMNNGIYCEVEYTVEGNSPFPEKNIPRDDPAGYMIAFLVISVLILALFFYAGLKPRWAKDGYMPDDDMRSSIRSPASSGRRFSIGKKQLIAIGVVAIVIIAGAAAYYVLKNNADPSPVLKDDFEVGDYYTYESFGERYTYKIEAIDGDVYTVSHSGSSYTQQMTKNEFLSGIMPSESDLKSFTKDGSEVIDTPFGRIRCDVWTASEDGISIKVWICPDNNIAFHTEMSGFGEKAENSLVEATIFR